MSAEFLIEQLRSSVEFLEHKVNTAKTSEEKVKFTKELTEARDQLERTINLNG